MTSREKVAAIFALRGSGGAMWTGNPDYRTVPIFAQAWGIEAESEAIYSYLEDDCRWITADAGYKHPEGRPALDTSYGVEKRATLSAGGSFAQAETVRDIEDYPWPDPRYCDFSDVYREIEKFPDKMVLTGLWSPFYHIVADFFGMENYFVLMYENPALVEAVTERVVDYYAAANEIFFKGLGDRADTFFFGNDMGTQLSLQCSPDMLRRFVLPSIRRLAAIAGKYGKFVAMHSCGSIAPIIPDIIDAGVEVLHPLQAGAAGMSAAELAKYRGDLAFLGGIDAQSFFVNATPEMIREEVLRVRSVLGPNLVVSPSHECILPNVPAENVLAMAKAAREPM